MDADEDDFYADEQDTDRCEHRGCDERAMAYDEEGRFLCRDHLEESILNQWDDEDEGD